MWPIIENWRTVGRIREAIDNKVYFAGDAYTNGEDWGNVHNAALSSLDAVNELVKS